MTTMPPDPTPLTEAEIQRLAELHEKATPICTRSFSVVREECGDGKIGDARIWHRDDVGRCVAVFHDAATANAYVHFVNAAPALLAAARENAERERTVGMCQKCGTRVAVKHGRVEEGGLLFHDVCHWVRQREFLIAENARIMNHLSGLLARVHRDGGHYEQKHGTDKARWDADEIVANLTAENAGLREDVKWLKEKRSVGFDNIDDLTTERDAAIRERDDRIRANVGLCEEIKNHRAERDMAQLELSRANVRYEQAHRRAEAMWRERDAALARVAELEAQIRQMTAKYESLEDSYQDMLERGANLAAKVAVFERILTPSLPDPKWVRCPSACSDGMIHAGSGVWRGCFTCGSSGRPGWVKEASQ